MQESPPEFFLESCLDDLADVQNSHVLIDLDKYPDAGKTVGTEKDVFDL